MEKGDRWRETERGEIIPPPHPWPEWRIKRKYQPFSCIATSFLLSLPTYVELPKKLAPPGEGVQCVR